MLKLKFKIIILAVVAFTTALFFTKSVVFASEKSLTIIAGDKRYEFYNYEIGFYNNEYFLKNASAVIDGIFLDTVINPIESKVVFKDNGEFYLTQSKNGKQIDKAALLNDVAHALNNGVQTVKAKFITTTPTVTKTALENQTLLRAGFTTNYPYSSQERKSNIRLAASKINGVKIGKNQEFSFNLTVGARTEENGFKTAKVIVNGNYVDGVGGGVCQVSTTLYNAAILSGLKITEHHSHSLPVSYIEPSFDAMVNSGTSDLKIANNTESDVYISAVADSEKITIKFYGSKQNEKYERVSVITNTIEPEVTEEILDDTLPYGEKVIIEKPQNGLESEGYLIKYEDGVRVKSYKLRSDKYKAVRGKTLIGTLNPTLAFDNNLQK